MHTEAMTAAGVDKFMRIVAVRATDNDHHIRLASQLDGGGLPLARRLAKSVGERDFRFRESVLNKLNESPDSINWLCGLCRDPKAWSFFERQHIFLSQYDVELGEI